MVGKELKNNEKIWCPLGILSGFTICPQNMNICPHYKQLFIECISDDNCTDVYFCELVTASMLLNRGNGIVQTNSIIPKYPEYTEMKKMLYAKYFKHLKD